MAKEYHYLVSGLTDINIDDKKLLFNQLDIRKDLRYNVTSRDYILIESLFLVYDNDNLINILTNNDSFDNNGNYTKDFIESGIRYGSDLPSYMRSFIYIFKSSDFTYDGISWEARLGSLYYSYVLLLENDFIRKWFLFELSLNNIITALNCRRHGYNLKRELVYIEGDNIYASLISKYNTRDFGIHNDFPFIDTLLSLYDNSSLLDRERAIDLYKWQTLDSLGLFYYFTIERLLIHILKLRILERWLHLDTNSAKEMFKDLFNTIEKDCELLYSYGKG